MTRCTSIDPDSDVVVTPTPGENSCDPSPSTARAEHQLRGVDAARKGQQGVRDVGPDHLVIGAAEVFHQHTLTCQMSRISTCQTVTAGDVYGEQIRPLVRAAMRAARRIKVSPSGPPVSATTTRSRVSQCEPML